MPATPTPIRRPGVDVIQAIRTEPLQVVQPILTPCIVGPCFKVLEVTNTDGSLNEDARLATPAMYHPQDLSGQVAATTASPVADETLELSVNEGAVLTVLFDITYMPVGGYTMANVAAIINTAAQNAGVALIAEVVPVGTGKIMLRIRTTATGDGMGLSAAWTSGTTLIATTFRLPISWKSLGLSRYDNSRLVLTKGLLPDPWGFGVDLDILEDTVRSFLTSGTAVKKEQYQTEGISRCGHSKMRVEDDGDGDGVSPILVWDLATVPPGANDAYTADIVDTTGGVPAYAVHAYDIDVIAMATTPTKAVATSAAVFPLGADRTFVLSIDGWQKQTILLPNLTTDVQAKAIIEKYFPGVVGTPGGGVITITSRLYGRESEIWISDLNAGVDALFLWNAAVSETANTYKNGKFYRGDWQPLTVGDEVWINGVKLGTVTKLVSVSSSGAAAQKVRLDTELALDYFLTGTPGGASAQNWYIVSKGLSALKEALLNTDRPSPELFIDQYLVQMRHAVLRGQKGDPMSKPIVPSDVTAYDAIFYKGLRLDVTVSAKTRDPIPVIVRGGDFVNLESQMAPLDAQNQLGLGMYFALLNSGQVPVYGFGVDEISSEYPDGTPDAYMRAFNALKAFRLYGIAPMSMEKEVAVNLLSHVLYMSATKRKGERYGFVSAEIPDRGEPTLIGSGTEGNAASGGSPKSFDTGLSDLSDLFIAAGVSGSGPFLPDTDGIYLNIEGDSKNYVVQSFAGSTIVCVDYLGTDSFFAPTVWAGATIDKSFAIYKRGAVLEDTAGNPDREAQCEELGKRAYSFKSRRLCHGAPGEFEAVVNGLDVVLPTYYLAAATVGLRCGSHPSRPITNTPIAGPTKVRRTNGYFDEESMDIAAGYGVWWWINDEATGTVITRHQLTTDTTSIKTREDSIRTAVDFGSYALRDALSSMIGTMNITPTVMDTLAVGVNGVLDFLVSSQVWLSAKLVRMVQGPFEATPEDLAEGLGPGEEDEVLVEVDATVGNPLNRVRIRIVV